MKFVSPLLPMMGHITLIQVDPGTEIKDPNTGIGYVVQDDMPVTTGRLMYVTPKLYEQIKARIDVIL